MTAEDRVAIILGRAIIRAEALQAANEDLGARLAEHENAAGLRSEPSDALRIEDVRDRLVSKLRAAPNDAHYQQVVVGLHDLAALLDEHDRNHTSEVVTDDA